MTSTQHETLVTDLRPELDFELCHLRSMSAWSVVLLFFLGLNFPIITKGLKMKAFICYDEGKIKRFASIIVFIRGWGGVG